MNVSIYLKQSIVIQKYTFQQANQKHFLFAHTTC